jgi:ribosomal protein L11 methyltransferase
MHEISVSVPVGAVEAVLDDLLALAPHGVQEVARGEQVELRVRGRAQELPPAAAIAAAAGPYGTTLREREVPDDWHERRLTDHEPLVVAGRIAVRPAWAPPAPAPLIDVVLADPDAFGSGGHPTTRACLEALCALQPAGAFADLGCGSGLLAIAAARLGWTPVIALDSSPDAVQAAGANAAASGVDVEARLADLAEEPAPACAALAANVPLSVHEAIGARLAAPPARLIASGILDRDADAAVGAYAAAGLRQVERRSVAGWAVLVLGRG